MRCVVHASSSAGNMSEIRAGDGQRVILDCGLTWRRTIQRLNYDISGVQSVFASHFHSDHCKALKDWVKHAVNVYANASTLNTLPETLRQSVYAHEVKDKQTVRLRNFDLFFFDLPHDTVPTLGCVVFERATSEHLLFCTDFAYIRYRFSIAFDAVLIGLNYNESILDKQVEEGAINETLAKRLLRSHPEEGYVLSYLEKYVDLSQCRELHLLHGSTSRLAKEKTKQAVKERLYMDVK